MPLHLQKNIDSLTKDISFLASYVEDATNKALRALLDRREDLAKEVIAHDYVVDEKEIEIEEECLKVLALHQPVASDLRFVVSIIKVNNEIERIGDLAVNIAERAAYLSRHEPLGITLDFAGMTNSVCNMLRQSLDALSTRDSALARKVLLMDDEVDDANKEMFAILQDVMQKDTTKIKRALHLLSVSRHLERIGDHATNIAEDVVYMVEGVLIRHKAEEFETETGA